jgi:7-carboxy-7-deazaguanine synthase
MRYPVNELFTTIQGEGSFTGTPATFVRLQGCPVGCAWCDTKHTWFLNEEHVVSDLDLDETGESDRYAWMESDRIISRTDTRHVVLTGGEPCLYDLTELTSRLLDKAHSVQIETSGTHEVRAHPDTFVTVAPKVGMPGGFSLSDSALARANEIKMPVGRMRDISVLEDLLERRRIPATTPIYLAPLSMSKKATELCVAEAIKHDWHLSIQTHKFLGLR